MAVFRIDKTKDYTVMANYHLRDVSLSLKAKGLLSLMLSLPDNWDYSTRGLSCICKDGIDSICSTIKELEKDGYVQRRRLRDAHGRVGEVEYTILEKPIVPTIPTAPERENPVQVKPVQERPVWEEPDQAEPDTENPAQLNIQQSITKKSNTDLSNTHSIYPEAVPMAASDGRTERNRIREQIEYSIMVERYPRNQLDEIVELMLEVSMNCSPTIRIGRDAEYTTAFVQDRFSRINSLHIERVMEGILDNRTEVKNTKAYLLATLFNSVSTIDHYYAMQSNYESGSSW